MEIQAAQAAAAAVDQGVQEVWVNPIVASCHPTMIAQPLLGESDLILADDRQRGLEAHGRGCVLAVTLDQPLGLSRVDGQAADRSAEAWQRLRGGAGMKAPRLSKWAMVSAAGKTRAGFRRGQLIRRSIDTPDEVAFTLTDVPNETILADFVRVGGTRWTIESRFEAAKGDVGLDEYDARCWTGWHRPITLAMVAHATLTVRRQRAIGGKRPHTLASNLPATAAPPALALGVGREHPDQSPYCDGQTGVGAISTVPDTDDHARH